MLQKCKKKTTSKWEKTFANNMSDKGFRFRKHKELLKLNKKINKFFKWAKELNRHIIKDIQMGNKNIRKCFTSYTIREREIKTRSYHDTERPKSRTLTTPRAGEGIENRNAHSLWECTMVGSNQL